MANSRVLRLQSAMLCLIRVWRHTFLLLVPLSFVFAAASASAQMVDNTQAINPISAGINKSLAEEIGAGRGSVNTPDSSLFIINRDAFRAVRRGRQLFQRKFTRVQGQGPGVDDGVGNIATTIGIGAGLADSCAACHGRPRGSAGFGGDVATRPDSRNAPHLFGLGLREMLADEMTSDAKPSQAQDRAVDPLLWRLLRRVSPSVPLPAIPMDRWTLRRCKG